MRFVEAAPVSGVGIGAVPASCAPEVKSGSMERQASRRRRAAAPKPAREDIRLQLIQIAGGDPAYEAKLREMIWQAYCEADRPYGPTEDDMFAWLEDEQPFL